MRRCPAVEGGVQRPEAEFRFGDDDVARLILSSKVVELAHVEDGDGGELAVHHDVDAVGRGVDAVSSPPGRRGCIFRPWRPSTTTGTPLRISALPAFHRLLDTMLKMTDEIQSADGHHFGEHTPFSEL